MESFGARLKRERQQRKISLDDISIATKIAPRFLVALEEDQFDQLPGGIFNKGFVRAYAHHLGLDETQTIADFVAASAPVVPESAPLDAPELAAMAVRVPETVARQRSDREGLPWGMFALALLVAAFGFAVWGFHSREKPAHEKPPRPAVAVQSGAGADTSGSAQKAGPDSEAKPASPETANPSQSTTPVAQSQETATPTGSPSDSAARAGGFLVLIKAREDAWVAITADGKQTTEDTLTASAEKAVEAQNQVVVKTGNVGALDISFNGKKLAPQGRFNQVKTLTFDPNGLRP